MLFWGVSNLLLTGAALWSCAVHSMLKGAEAPNDSVCLWVYGHSLASCLI